MTQVLLAGAGVEPDEAVCGAVELLDLGIAGGGVLPDRVGLAVKEQRAVAGVFGIEVDLPGEDRGAHDIGRPELDAAHHRQTARLDHLGDHVAEQRPLGVDLRGDDNRLGRCRTDGREQDGEALPPAQTAGLNNTSAPCRYSAGKVRWLSIGRFDAGASLRLALARSLCVGGMPDLIVASIPCCRPAVD